MSVDGRAERGESIDINFVKICIFLQGVPRKLYSNRLVMFSIISHVYAFFSLLCMHFLMVDGQRYRQLRRNTILCTRKRTMSRLNFMLLIFDM